jgi:tRNA A37 threonylcarbamoyladenosine modification protein TsaB
MTNPTRPGLDLWLDTVGPALQVAFSHEEAVLWQHLDLEVSENRRASATLHDVVAQGLQILGHRLADVCRVGLHYGPGSFTGVRTSTVMAKTLAHYRPGCVLMAFDGFVLASDPEARAPQRIALPALRESAYVATLQWTPPTYITVEAPFWTPQPPAGLVFSALPENRVARMHALWRRFSETVFAVPWRQLEPLYIQSPNITPRKPKDATS